MKKFLFASALTPLLFLSFALPVLAAPQDSGANAGDDSGSNVGIQFRITNPFNVGDNLFELMESILDNIVIPIGGMLCVLAFIWGGFQYVMAQGNSGKISDANKTLLYAAIGTAVIFGAKLIQLLIQTTFTELLK